MRFLKFNEFCLSGILAISLTSCVFTPDENVKPMRQTQFKLKIKKINHNRFLVWPHNVKDLPKDGAQKLSSLVDMLSKSNDVDIEIIPIYKMQYSNQIYERGFLIRDVLFGFGVPFNKIHIRERIEPKTYEEGFIININAYELKVPNCDEFKDEGAKSMEESMKSFGCATVANFGKMIAYPSSLDKYKKTQIDRSTAMKALQTVYQSNGDGG